jgi:hypothetical protein
VFEDSFLSRKTNGRTGLKKFLPLGISIIFHGLLVYGLFHARITIKMLAVQSTVSNIKIAPPLTPPVPKIVGSPGTVPAGGGMASREKAEAAGGGAARRAAPEAIPPAIPPAGPPVSPAGPAPQTQAIPSLSSKFQESMVARSRSGQESGLRITLGPPGSKPGLPAGAKVAPPNFYSYLPGPVGSGAGGYGTGTARAGRATGGQKASMSIPLKGYNLTPWAQKVLELIVKNWNLPWVGRIPDKAIVKLAVVFRKNGEIASLELVEGTALDALDEAALNAVRMSFPFPSLPDDFPADLLEASIEFNYHD